VHSLVTIAHVKPFQAITTDQCSKQKKEKKRNETISNMKKCLNAVTFLHILSSHCS